MLRYTLRRLIIGAGMLLALTVLIFVLLRLTPGDPIDAYINPNVAMSQAEMDALRARLGLDQPLPVQYFAWLGAGRPAATSAISIQRSGEPVCRPRRRAHRPDAPADGRGDPAIAIVVGIVAGIIGAVRRNSPADLVALGRSPSSASRARPS